MKLSTQYGEFLGTIDWNYFSTLSFKWDVKQKQCEKRCVQLHGCSDVAQQLHVGAQASVRS